jgi:hypothetical protein
MVELKQELENIKIADELAQIGLAERLKNIEKRISKLESEKSKKASIKIRKSTLNLDYDLFVIDPNNKDSTPEQLRDCIYDALKILDERTK